MTSAALVGTTGLVGSQILTTLLSHPSLTSTIHTFSRRAPPPPPTTTTTTTSSSSSSSLEAHTSPDSSTWTSTLSSLSPPPSIFFSALGTTRSSAGSVAAQRAIDYDLNLSLAQAALKSGTQVYVLVSTSGANAHSMLAYAKMKGELEVAVQKLGFKTVVILRPGLLLGQREERRPAEAVVRAVAGWANALAGNRATDFWAQKAETVGRAAVKAGIEALEGEKGALWELGQSDIVRMGREEWKE